MNADDLSLLVADEIEAIEAVQAYKGLQSAKSSLPAPDFTGSLDYIDSLASRSAISVSRRDLAKITTGLSTFDYLSPLLYKRPVPGAIVDRDFNASTDFRPLQDGRKFDPSRSTRRPAGLVRSSSEVVSHPSPKARIATPEEPYMPWEVEEIVRSPGYKEATRNPFQGKRAFRNADQTVICLKRKIRKGIMHAFGFAGLKGFRPARRNYWSRVIC